MPSNPGRRPTITAGELRELLAGYADGLLVTVACESCGMDAPHPVNALLSPVKLVDKDGDWSLPGSRHVSVMLSQSDLYMSRDYGSEESDA